MRYAFLAMVLSACSPPPEPDAGRDVARVDAALLDTQTPDVRDVQARDVTTPDVRDVQTRDVVCGDGSAACSGACVDLTRDEANCGACGVVCAPINPNQSATCGEHLGSIMCIRTCRVGFGDCNVGSDGNGDTDGCETFTSTPEHCGGCEIHCGGQTPRCVNMLCVP